MNDTRLEWCECELCGMAYTWFRVQVTEDIVMYGWLHKTDGDCPRDKGLHVEYMSGEKGDGG
jgi:hypothetical protein